MSIPALRFNQMPEIILLPHSRARVNKDHVETVEPDTPLSFREEWIRSFGYGPEGFHTLSQYIEQTAHEFMQYQISPHLTNIEKIKSGQVLELSKKEFEHLIEAMHTLDQVKLNTEALQRKIFQAHFYSAKLLSKCFLVLTIAFEKIKALYIKLRYKRSCIPIPYLSPHSLEDMRARAIDAKHRIYELNPSFQKPHLLWKGQSLKSTYHLTLSFSRVSQQLKFYKDNIFQGQVVFSKMTKAIAEEQTLLIFYDAIIIDPEAGHLFATFFNQLLIQKVVNDLSSFPHVPYLLLMRKPPQYVRENISYQELDVLHKMITQDLELFPDLIPISTLIKAAEAIS